MTDFTQALTDLNNGEMVKRTGWTNGVNFIVIFDPMAGSSASGEVIMQDINNAVPSPWRPQSVDILAQDWEIFVPGLVSVADPNPPVME